MNLFRLALFSTTFLLCSANPGIAQRLIFSGDTAILASCDKVPLPIEDLEVYNNTDEDIRLKWERTQLDLPDESFFLMIISGLQYFHYISHGAVSLDARDSTNIIFSFIHDTLVPGDSVIVQINIYDEADSVNTAKLQTVIQYCPLTTADTKPEPGTSLRVYPNPVSDNALIMLPENPAVTSLLLYDITGQVVRQIPVTSHEITFSRNGLPYGLYFLGMLQKGLVRGMTKIVIAE